MIAFVAAEAREFAGLELHLQNRRRLSLGIDHAVSGTLKGRPVILAANGPGRNLARAAAREAGMHEGDTLVSVGFCGGVAARLAASDIFIATSINGTPVHPPSSTPPCARGALLSVDRVITTAEEKRTLGESGVEAVEMEAAGLQPMALGGFHCVRVVTDTAGESFPLDFNEMRDQAGRFSRLKIAAHACRHPFQLVPELFQLDRRCRSAARVLGDFIADCQF